MDLLYFSFFHVRCFEKFYCKFLTFEISYRNKGWIYYFEKPCWMNETKIVG